MRNSRGLDIIKWALLIITTVFIISGISMIKNMPIAFAIIKIGLFIIILGMVWMGIKEYIKK